MNLVVKLSNKTYSRDHRSSARAKQVESRNMGLKRHLDEEVIAGIHHTAWEQEVEKSGNKFTVPGDQVELISERNRALCVLLIWQKNGCEGSAARFMDKYALRLGSQDWALKEFAHEADAIRPEPKKNRKALLRGFETWATEHVFEQFTTAQLAEQSGFSQATVLKYLKTSRYFKKLKRGLYEARDPLKKNSAESN
jgi:hypothetical protein